jgi:hypothetical protein
LSQTFFDLTAAGRGGIVRSSLSFVKALSLPHLRTE